MAIPPTETLRSQALELLDERDIRFFDSQDIYCTFKTAGEIIRLHSREPFVNHEAAAALETAAREYSIPAMDDRDLTHFIYCLRLCPRKGTRA